MRVGDVQVVSLADACELRARVKSDADPEEDRWFEGFDLWYRFPPWCSSFLRPDNGDPFLAALLVAAMTLGERLEIPAPVSSTLLRALPEIQSILHCFDPRQSRIEVTAPVRERSVSPKTAPPSVGLFFSLGIDSYYSLLKNERDYPNDDETVTDLITVHGMDVWHDGWDEQFPAALLENSRRVAISHGKTHLPVVTNVRAVVDPLCLWTMAHGGGIASIALALGGYFRTVRIAAATTYDQLYPWGSHPVLDPLWATDEVKFIHDGCELDRIGKTAVVAQSQLALDTLRICPGYTPDYNCGRCVKCLPTMIDLLHLGVLDRCLTLPHTVDAEQLRQILATYRGGLNVEGYRQRRDAFTDGAHADLRAVLTAYLAEEDATPATEEWLPATDAEPRRRRIPRWFRWRRGSPR